MKTASRTARKSSSKAAAGKAAARSSSRKQTKAAAVTIKKVRGADLAPPASPPAAPSTPREPITHTYVAVIRGLDDSRRIAFTHVDELQCKAFVDSYNEERKGDKRDGTFASVRQININEAVDDIGERVSTYVDNDIDAQSARALRAARNAQPFGVVVDQFYRYLEAASIKATGGDLPAKALAGMIDGVLFEIFSALDHTMIEAGATRGYAACNCRVKNETTNEGEAR